MTVPVKQSEGEKISMTAPVLSSTGGDDSDQGRYVFSFIMPSQYTLETLPVPTDSRIKTREVPGKLVAARRYSGSWSERRYRDNERALLDAMRAAGIEATADPVFARYNGPFTLWFLRRNEVMVEVAAADGTS